MFLENTIKYNPKLIQEAVRLHQAGRIPANTYLVDLDMVKRNARIMKKEADRYHIKLYFMSKQFNRNPLISHAIVKSGIPSAVAVETQGAKNLNRYGVPVGHVGHLVPIPKSEIEDILDMNPEVITIYGVEKAKQISEIAQKKDKVQDILLRIRDKDDIIWPNEEGGFSLNDIEKVYLEIIKYKGVRVSGLVSFPMFLYCEKTGKGQPTPNFFSVMLASKKLEKLGANIKQINSPGDTSTKMIKIISENGGTHGEPGHGLIGTTPWHFYEKLPELPSMVYVNEISHFYGSKAYVFGGGFYVCYVSGANGFYYNFRKKNYNWVPNALVGNSQENIFDKRVPVISESFLGHSYHATDYISELYPEPGCELKVGDTVIYGFRAQVFVTRSYVAVVKGIQSGDPKLFGVFDRANNLLDEKLYPIKNGEEKVWELINQV